MTDDRRAAMVEKVADLVRFNHDPIAIANEAISLIRAEVLEEAAVACENIYGDDGHGAGDWPTPEECAAEIRALKEVNRG